MTFKKRKLLTTCLLTALGLQAFASGYQVSLQGQKQIGMGHTGTGLVLDASTIFFNPAGMSFLKKNNIILGASFITNKIAYYDQTSQTSAKTNSPLGTPFMGYAAFKALDGKLGFGIGVYTPYGSSVKWQDGWKGEAVLQSLSLQSIYIQPTASYRLTDNISIGAGFIYALGSVDLKRAIPVTTEAGYGQAQLKGNANGIGFNAGIYLKASEKLSIGATYRSQVSMKVKSGDATFNTTSLASQPGGTFPAGGTKFDATLPLPAVASIGIGYKATDKLTLAADVNYTFWSVYKELKFNFDQSVNGSTTAASQRSYKDSPAFRLGAAYEVAKVLTLRGGAYYDMTPVKSGYMTPETPDMDRIGLSLGAGINPTENLSIDLSVLFINGLQREQTVDQVNSGAGNTSVLAGKYAIKAFVPGISLAYSF